jgi:hypothetical protein
MKEILKMELRDFDGIVDRFVYENTPREHRYKKELSNSQKDMIKYHKKHLQKDGKVI